MQQSIMIIDQHEKNLQTMQELVKSHGYLVVDVSSQDELGEALASSPFELVLINTSTPFIDIKEICAFIRSHDNASETAVIFISQDQNNKKEAIHCFDAGGNDYMKKPVIPEELMARIRFHTAQKKKLNDYSVRYEKLAAIAAVDHVSKVSSKLQMQMLLRQQTKLHERYGEKISIIYLCIMELKKINTLLGHNQCDKLIFNFAKILKENLRSSDEIGRWVGGEFVVLLPKTDAQSAVHLARKINQTLKKHELFRRFSVECRFGITQIGANDTTTDIIDRSRNAMYSALQTENKQIAVC